MNDNVKIYNDILYLFSDMKLECSKEIMRCDHCNYFAWCDLKSGFEYKISLFDTSRSFDNLKYKDKRIINDCFLNKKDIWIILNTLSQLDRLSKLKSFW